MRDQNLEINPDYVAVLRKQGKKATRAGRLSVDLLGQSLVVGAGSKLRKMLNGTGSVDPGSIAATSTGTGTLTITGAVPGDRIVLHRPAGLNDDLIYSGHRISAASTVLIYLYNPTAGAIDDGANDWEWLWLDFT